MNHNKLRQAVLACMTAGVVSVGDATQAQVTAVADDETLVRIRTRGEQELQTGNSDEKSSSEQLQPDRRVTVELERGGRTAAQPQPGKAAVIGKWATTLPDGGVIWATEDPALGVPELNVSASPLTGFDGSKIIQPVKFYVYSNYPAFVERAEIVIYRATDTDLVSPLTTIPVDRFGSMAVEWDGKLPENYRPRLGDELVYVLRAYGANDARDETFPRRLQLVTAEDVKRSGDQLRTKVERQYSQSFSSEEAQQRSLLETTFAENGLRQQNIAIYGSRVRLQGRNIPVGTSVFINGQTQPLDLERKLVAEYLLPLGKHAFNIELKGKDQQTLQRTIDVEVTGRYMFAVALADLTASGSSVSGSIEPLGSDDRYDDSFLLEGRLAFYLRGKVKGKYLITAQADTRERELEALFDNFGDADAQDVFRRLDPDAYYPVYGDDSNTYRDVDTQGRFYVRVDWDKNQALWGNFNTGITGTEFAQYSRALYGAAANMRSRETTQLGDAVTEWRVFGSEAQTAPGHNEFIGTGGSLYYLKNTDILPGSDRVVLEVRDRTTGRVENRIDLLRGADYEIDEFQGRIILTRPLAQVTRDNVPTLTRDAPLDGLQQILLVDYEYIPNGFDANDITAGFRGKHWLGNHVAIGGTYVDENRSGDDYLLRGVDLTLQPGRGTYLKVERTESESTSAPVFFSDNGGLSFGELNSGLGSREGEATALEARANLKEMGISSSDWSAGSWWRKLDDEFSIARFDSGAAIEEHGVELKGELSPSFNLYTRYSRAERDIERLTQAQVTGEWRLADNRSVSGELRRANEQRATFDAAGTLAALQYRQRFGSKLELYGIGQVTVDDDSGQYADNNAITLGSKYLFGQLSNAGAELTSGDRGNALQVNLESQLSADHTVYSRYTYSTDQTDFDPLFNDGLNSGWTLGQRWRLSQQTQLFNESQYLKAPNEAGLAHTFGMDFYPGIGWNLGFQLQAAELDREIGLVDRRAISLSGGRAAQQTQWQSKLEWREDSGAERRDQWVTTHRWLHKLNENLRFAARLNYSETDDRIDTDAGARFMESNIGFAWRPAQSSRHALLGKYTFLYDVSALPQTGINVALFDQRSHVLALEGIYQLDRQWEFASKVMRREGEVRFGRFEGQWTDSATSFLAGQARYRLADVWYGLVEYRWLGVQDGGNRQGALIGVDRDIGERLRIGAGYNFTDFSDDLTDFDYDHQGWYFNLVGKY